MFRPRIIPVLLLKDRILYKSVRFKDHHYIGDPINAVKIFNDLNADELAFMDINASSKNKPIDLSLIEKVAEEANMPFSVGGGISNTDQIRDMLNAGAEKVIINSAALKNPDFIKKASDSFGASTIVVCIDLKTNLFGKLKIWNHSSGSYSGYDPIEYASLMEKNGAGEIIIQSVDKDGLRTGYDLPLISKFTYALTIPVVALGGAGTMIHLHDLYSQTNVNALAAGSLFVFHGAKKGVLINYPDKTEKSLIAKHEN